MMRRGEPKRAPNRLAVALLLGCMMFSSPGGLAADDGKILWQFDSGG